MNTFIKSLLLTLFISLSAMACNAQAVTYLQITHNSAQPTLDTIDLYFNGAVLDSNVVYHTATGFFAYQPDTAFTIGILHKHSNGNPNADTVRNITFPGFGEYLFNTLVISGVDSNGFVPNPNGLDTGISIQTVNNVDSVAADTGVVTIRFFNGVTDLPGITIKYRNGATLFQPDITYGSSSGDVVVHHSAFEFQVINTATGDNFGTFTADLTGLGGQSIIILASGFLNPAANDSGQAFGLYALLNTGALLTLPIEQAGFQLLNNCADPASDSLDVYINGNLAFNLSFRNATPAILFNAYATYDVGIARKNSASVADTFWHDAFFLPRDTFFIATATGLLSQTGFAPNPNGISTAFDVLIKSPAEFAASSASDFDFFMINGVTDAPALNLQAEGGPVLLNNVDYANETNYVSIPSEYYTMYVEDTLGNTLLNGFANFPAFNAQSGVLLTSGFLTPGSNNNGPAMGLYMVSTTGGAFIPLFNPTGIHSIAANTDLNIYPNPASNELHVSFTLAETDGVSLQITDLNGNLVMQVLNTTALQGKQNVVVNVSKLAQGIYFSRLITSTGAINSRFAVLR